MIAAPPAVITVTAAAITEYTLTPVSAKVSAGLVSLRGEETEAGVDSTGTGVVVILTFSDSVEASGFTGFAGVAGSGLAGASGKLSGFFNIADIWLNFTAFVKQSMRQFDVMSYRNYLLCQTSICQLR